MPSGLRCTTSISVAIFLSFGTPSVTPSLADWGSLSPLGAFPITLDEAPRLFEQCSRSAPNPDGEFWIPSKTEINRLEAELAAQITKYRRTINDPRTFERHYRGQYVGFVRANTRYIYASYSPDAYWPSHLPSGKALVVCDGGPNYWGIVYNPATGQFSELQTNGR